MRVLGVDLGTKRIGLALSDPDRIVATPHRVLRRAKSPVVDYRVIAAIVDEWKVGRIVVGLPLSLDSTPRSAAESAIKEAKVISSVTGVPTETYDERLTTVSAHQVLREQGVAGPNRRDIVDMVAAVVLLQAWLDTQHASVPDIATTLE